MDANRLCRWLIPAGWPESYTKILFSSWQIEDHEDKSISEGKSCSIKPVPARRGMMNL